MLHILAAALSGVNVGNCEHACVREPCLNGGMCIPMQEDFACHCPIGYRDARCSSSLSLNIKAPMLTGASFLHFTNYNITKHFENGDYSAIEMQFRCLGSDGLLVWAGAADKDYLGIGLQQGYLHFRYNLGSGEVIIKENRTRVDDGKWHTFIAVRRGQEGSLMVDERDVVTGSSPGHMRHLNSNTGLYIGGVPDPSLVTLHKYRSGFFGCVSELVLSRGYTVSLISQASDGRNVDQCV